MRPVELKLRNFRSYFGDDAAFDFRGRRLIGIVGPIGSGKSTILDAIAFALYGRTPSVGKGTKALIHQRSDHATVAFRFEVDGELWEAQRMLRRKGASQHALYRLEDDGDDAEKVEQITGEAEVTARIAELLGLDFDAFGRSVLLAQGRFAEFLTARPAERDKVLKGVFGHDRIDRMRTVAKERAREAEIEAEKATVTVQHLAELEATTSARKEDLTRDRDRLRALEEIEPQVREHRKAIEAARTEQESADRELGELRSVIEAFPDDNQLGATIASARSAAEQRLAVGELLVEARAAVEAAEQRVTESAAIRETLDAASSLLAAGEERAAAAAEAEGALARGKERLQQAVAEVAGQSDRVALAEREARQAAELLGERSAALSDAEVAYHDAVHADIATTLRRELHEGGACPVCEQVVTTVPAVEDAVDVAGASAAVEAAREQRTHAEQANTKAVSAQESAKTAHEDANRRLGEAETAVGELEERQERAQAATAATTAEVVALLGSDDVEATVASMHEELTVASSALEGAVTARDRAHADHDAAIEAEQAAQKRLADIRVTLAGVAARLDDGPTVGDDAESIGEAAVALRAIAEQAVHDASKRHDQAATLIDDHQQALAVVAKDAGLTTGFDEALAGLRSRIEVLEEEIARGELRLADRAEHIERRDAHVATTNTYQTLAGDLTDARFVRYLLDDERRNLAELGSEHFQRLTNGRYRFTEDGAFDIVDLTTADAVRKADSLSGGETFLASLGLALALAEIVSRGGGRLDAFFLDEGFGTLDPEHLDLAMEGVESLVSDDGDRLVVVVSHVPELRHRIEDLIELDRSRTTGDTEVLTA